MKGLRWQTCSYDRALHTSSSGQRARSPGLESLRPVLSRPASTIPHVAAQSTRQLNVADRGYSAFHWLSVSRRPTWLVGNARRSSSSSAPSSSTLPRSRRNRLLTILGAALGGIVVIYIIDEKFQARILQRNLRTAYTGLAIALDYKLHFDADDPDAIAGVHERCADLLFRTCEANQGLYIKVAQAVGANAIILPPAYLKFTKMFDDVERMPWEEVRKVVSAELASKGALMDEVFSSFEQSPVAAASVAQVHRATLRSSGETVAVKVQRPSIRAQAFWDLLCFRILLKFYERIFDLPISYFGGYISQQIELETHFDAELKNCVRIREHIEADKSLRKSVTVPKVFPDISSDRLLVMDWIGDACKMTDRDKIESMGLSIRKVADDVCNVFAAMIFQYGSVQADGHAGNVLVRKHPDDSKRHQVVLIDHGLYVELSDKFRNEYAQLWKAIFTIDLPVLERITADWGMGHESAELFASATLMRPWSNPKKRKSQAEMDAAQAKEAEETRGMTEKQKRKRRHQARSAKQKELIKNFLVRVELVPKELIFVGRSMRIVQANNQTLGSPVNRINILARHAADALVTTDQSSSSLLSVIFPSRYQHEDKTGKVSPVTLKQRLGTYLASRSAFLRFRSTLLLLDIAFYTSAAVRWVSLFFRSPLYAVGLSNKGVIAEKERKQRRGGFEDDLEKSMQRLAKDELGVELHSEAFEG